MASDLYTAAWDYGRLNLGAVAGGNAAVFSGSVTGNVGWTTGVYMHSSVTGTCDGQSILAFRAAIIAIAAGLTITWSPTTGLYTLSNAGAFTVTWNGLLGAQIRDALGFAGADTGSATSHTSTVRPDYLIISRLAGQTAVHDSYEPGGRINYSESDDGTSYSTRPSTIPTYQDWTQPFESKLGPTNAEFAADNAASGAALRRVDAVTGVSWTWEDFIKHCRAELPFALLDRSVTANGEGALYKMRGSKANFDPTRFIRDFDGYWSILFETKRLTATVTA